MNVYKSREFRITRMLLSRRKAVTTTTTIAVVVIVLIAGVGVTYFALNSSATPTQTTTTATYKVFRILMFTTTPATTSWGAEITRGLNQAVSALNNTNGYTLKTTTAFNIAYGDAQSFMQSYAQQGYNLIMAQDVGYAGSVAAVAAQFPNVQFWGPTFGDIVTANLGAWSIDHWKGEYMAGVVAGLMTTTNKIGFVTAFEYSQTIEAINVFRAGAKLVNPNVHIYYAFAGSWSDSVKGSSAAASVAASGADVIATFGDGMADGAVAGAKQAGAFAIGYLHDANSLAPQTILTSVLLNSTAYYVKAIVAAESFQLGFKNFILDIYPDHVTYLTQLYNVPADKATQANTFIQKIASGQLVPPENTTAPSQGY